MLLLILVAALVPGITYATPNQSVSDNCTNTTNISEIVENNTSSIIIQNTTTKVVNDTGTSQQENQTSELTNKTQNSSSDNSNQTDTIQNNSAAASDGTYNNVHAIYLNVDDVNNVNVDKLIAAGITDVFVKSNRITYPTYQTILTKIIDKLNNTDIRIHAWITCFVDANGNWVDPTDSDYRDALVKAIADITKNYDIDGIHLDYVRYPGTAYNHTGGTAAITSFAEEVYYAVKSINAKIAVSAAVMPECSVNAYYYGQSYTALSKYLTFIVPMVYEGNYNEDNNWITTVTNYIVNHSSVPVIVALQTYGSDDDLECLSVEEIDADIKSALSGGASGFALFRYGWVDSNWYTTTSSDTTSNSTTKPTSTTSFTIAQVVKAASEVRGYIEAFKALPTLITVGDVLMSQSQFLYLLSVATLQIDDGGSGLMGLLDVTALTGGSESMSAGTLSSSAYLELAGQLVSFIEGTSTSPSLCKTSLGYLSYQSVIYMYSRILDQYGSDGDLPALVAVKSWSSSNLPIADLDNLDSFTVDEVVKAASEVRGYIEAFKALPTLITVGDVLMSQSQFLYLLSVATLQIDDGGSGLMGLLDVTALTGGSESMSAGTLSSSAYLELAGQLVSFIEGTSTSPSLCKTSLGYLSYQSVIYMYSRILDQYGSDGDLPALVAVKSWSSSNLPIADLDNLDSFTVDEVVKAASEVRGYIEAFKALPTLITVGDVLMSQSQFLYLLSVATLQIDDGGSGLMGLLDVTALTGGSESMSAGTLSSSAYLELAGQLVSFIEGTSTSPSLCKTSLGYLSYQSVIYMYSRILDQYSNDDELPGSVVVLAWSSSNIPINDNLDTFTISQIVSTAGAVKGYVEVYKTLPTLINVAGVYVNQAQFLYLLTTCVSQLNDGITTSIGLISADVAQTPSETMTSGNLTKSEYLDLASRIMSFMDSNGVAPNYGSTTLGTIRFESLIYLYSRVAAFYGTNNYLPNYAVMKSWSSIISSSNTSTSTDTIPSSLQIYLQATANCESNDASIIALAQSITSGASTSYEKAVLIYNWVRDNLSYSFYYNTQKGAVGTLQSMSANCCDHAHLVVALSRAAGLPARYVHGYCYFTSSGTWYGHVWAEVYAGGWITADATSSRNSLGVVKNWDTSSWTYKGTYAELPF